MLIAKALAILGRDQSPNAPGFSLRKLWPPVRVLSQGAHIAKALAIRARFEPGCSLRKLWPDPSAFRRAGMLIAKALAFLRRD